MVTTHTVFCIIRCPLYKSPWEQNSWERLANYCTRLGIFGKFMQSPDIPSLSSSPSNWTAVAGFVLAEIQSCFFGKSHLDIIGTNPKRTVGQIPWTIESRLEQFDCSHENFSVATHPHIALLKLTDLRKKSNGIRLNVFTEPHLK